MLRSETLARIELGCLAATSFGRFPAGNCHCTSHRATALRCTPHRTSAHRNVFLGHCLAASLPREEVRRATASAHRIAARSTTTQHTAALLYAPFGSASHHATTLRYASPVVWRRGHSVPRPAVNCQRVPRRFTRQRFATQHHSPHRTAPLLGAKGIQALSGRQLPWLCTTRRSVAPRSAAHRPAAQRDASHRFASLDHEVCK